MNTMKLISCTILVSCLTLVQIAHAQSSDLVSKLKVCSQIGQDTDRLTCFDALTEQKQSVTTVETKIVTSAAVLTDQQIDAFAKEHVKKTDEELASEINSISLTISELTKTTRGYWKITFSNGQKWQQKDNTKLKLALGEKVILMKGALSSVYLKKENTNKRIKVKRLK